MKLKINWDALGISASVACAIHCAVLPLLMNSLPILGIELLHNTGFEFFMIALSFAIGVYSLSHGYKRHHHSLVPMVVFTIGFGFLVAKQFMPAQHQWMVLVAMVFIVAAHFWNFRSCRIHNHAHDDDCNH